jgi:Tfp pilus assembly protein PilO
MNNTFMTRFTTFLRRYLFGAVSIIVGVVCLIAAGYLWYERDELENRLRERTEEGQAMLATVMAGPILREELAAVRQATRRIDDNLVIETNLSENLWYFYKFEERTKIHLEDLHQLNIPAIDNDSPYKLVSYSLRGTGTYAQIMAFLQNVEAGPRLMILRSFSLTRATSATATPTDLDAIMGTTGGKAPAPKDIITLELTLDMLAQK